MYVKETELFHHGIKGQKWGVENGPPYPLKGRAKKKQYKEDYKKAEESANKKYKVNELYDKANKEWKESQETGISEETSRKLNDAISKAEQEARQTMVNQYGEKYVHKDEKSTQLKGTAGVMIGLGVTAAGLYGTWKVTQIAGSAVSKAGSAAVKRILK